MIAHPTEVQSIDPAELARLHDKVDRLTTLLEAQQQRQAAFDELLADLSPIARQAVRLASGELAEYDGQIDARDLRALILRLLRSAPLLLHALDQLEALSDLGEEAGPIGRQVLSTGVETLDRLERRGYFAFARQAGYVLDQIVTEFDEEDVRALGDNIVTILKTVRDLTQPDVMNLVSRAAGALRESATEDADTSLLALARELRDPQVRKGMARLLGMLRVLADHPVPPVPIGS